MNPVMYDSAEPFTQTRSFSLLMWVFLIIAALGVAALLLRQRSSQDVLARLNAIMGPLLLGFAWLYGVVFEPGRNFGALASLGFLRYWFQPRSLRDVGEHPALFAMLTAVGVAMILLFGVRSTRNAAAARGTLGPLLSLALWGAAAIFVYYVPWSLADILTHYADFQDSPLYSVDLLELFQALAQDGTVLAVCVSLVLVVVAWELTSRSWRQPGDAAPSAHTKCT